MQGTPRGTLHFFGGGAVNLTFTVLDTADYVAGKRWGFTVEEIVACLAAQGLYVGSPTVYNIVMNAAKAGIFLHLGGDAFEWKEEAYAQEKG